MSIFSWPSSFITARTRDPSSPMHEPFALTPGFVARTASFVRWPASRARDTTSTVPSAISGASWANSRLTRFGWVRETVTEVPLVPLWTLAMYTRIRVPWLYSSPGDLFVRGQHGLDVAEVDLDHLRVPALLDGARGDLTLTALERAEQGFVLDIAQPLVDDLTGRLGGDAAEARGGVVDFADGVVVVVELHCEDAHFTGGLVECGAGVRPRPLGLLVGEVECLFDEFDEGVERNLPLLFDHAQNIEIDVHVPMSSPAHSSIELSVF